MEIPPYVTKLKISNSAASLNKYTAEGMVITGPNTGRYLVVRGATMDGVMEEFMEEARRVKASVTEE